jgi:phage/plasmid-associated DNA primase
MGMRFSYKPHDTSIDLKQVEPITIHDLFRQIQNAPIYTIVNDNSDLNIAKYLRENLPQKYCYDCTLKKWYQLDEYNKYVRVSEERESPIIRNTCREFLIKELNQVSNEMKKLTTIDGIQTDDKNMIQSNIECVDKIIRKTLQSTSSFDAIFKGVCDIYADSEIYQLLDNRNELFAFNNVVFDALTGKIRPIQPNDYILTHTGYNWVDTIDISAKQRVQSIINNLFSYRGGSDEELQIDIRQFLVYISTILVPNRTDKYQIFTISQGRGGNGKSLMDSIHQMSFGDYFTSCEYTVFTEINDKARPSAELLSLKGKRYISTSEVPSGLKLNTTTLKKFCSDNITTRGLYQSTITTFRAGHVNFNINDDVAFTENDGGIRRRMKNVLFPNTFVDPKTYQEKADKNAFIKLKDITILDDFRNNPALKMEYMRIIIDTYMNYLHGDRPLPISEKHEHFTEEYLENTNPIADYFSQTDRYVITNDMDDVVLLSEVYKDYEEMYKKRAMSDKMFSKNIKHMNLDVVKSKKSGVFRDKRVIVGVKEIQKDCIIDDTDSKQITVPPITINQTNNITVETPPTLVRPATTRAERRINMRSANFTGFEKQI